jgi:hypothetical protein
VCPSWKEDTRSERVLVVVEEEEEVKEVWRKKSKNQSLTEGQIGELSTRRRGKRKQKSKIEDHRRLSARPLESGGLFIQSSHRAFLTRLLE